MNKSASSAPDAAWAWKRLEVEHVLILEHLAALRRGFQQIVEASADSNSDDEHDPEGSTIAFERAQLNSLIRQAERHLHDVQDARTKVSSGTYGLCETCGRPIAAARLDARPVARRCILCAALPG